jgi:integrase
MSSLMRFCSERRIAPVGVSDAVAENFLDWLRDETFVKRPQAVHRRCLVHWNKCSATITGWPNLNLAILNNRDTYCVSWSDLPASLRDDAEAWLRHLADADPISLDGPAWPARPATIKTRRFQVRQLVSALVRRGHDISKFETLRNLVEPSVAQEALRFFYERNGKNKSSQVAGLATVVFMIAKHWCKLKGEQLDRLALLKRNLAYRLKGMTSKNRERLRQFTDRRNIEALIFLPQKIHGAVRRNSDTNIADALDMQVAVAVEMLLMMPVRRGNVVRLRFGPEGHIRSRQDRHGTTHIVINGSDVKNKVDLEYPLPRESSDLLEIYIKRFRPILAKSPSYWVIPGEGPSGHKALDQFSRQFKKTVRKWTGLDVNIHLMRHIGAKLYLDANPGAYEVVRRVLGHKSLSTTVNNYTGLEIEAAVRHFDAVILGIRDAIGRRVSND